MSFLAGLQRSSRHPSGLLRRKSRNISIFCRRWWLLRGGAQSTVARSHSRFAWLWPFTAVVSLPPRSRRPEPDAARWNRRGDRPAKCLVRDRNGHVTEHEKVVPDPSSPIQSPTPVPARRRTRTSIGPLLSDRDEALATARSPQPIAAKVKHQMVERIRERADTGLAIFIGR